MKTRRKSRELALQALFYMDMRQNISLEALELYCQCFPPQEKCKAFFLKLTKGVMQHSFQIDPFIEQFSSNWKLSRMPLVDRNIMRIAVYEMLFCDDIPLKVSINEAIDIGKRFGTQESGAFINGILDSIHIALANKEIQPDLESEIIIPERININTQTQEAKKDEADKVTYSRVLGKPGVLRRRVSAPLDTKQKQ